MGMGEKKTFLSPAASPSSETGAVAQRSRLAAIRTLRDEVHALSPKEAGARIASLASSVGPPPPRQNKIAHFVVLFMENQATDVFAGCMERPGLDNIRNATIPKDPTKPSGGNYTFKCHKEYICSEGPTYDPAAVQADDAFAKQMDQVAREIGDRGKRGGKLPAAAAPAPASHHPIGALRTNANPKPNLPIT